MALPEQLRQLREQAAKAEADRRAAVTRADAYEARAREAAEQHQRTQEHAQKLADLLAKARADLDPVTRERDELRAEIEEHRRGAAGLDELRARADAAEGRAAEAEAQAEAKIAEASAAATAANAEAKKTRKQLADAQEAAEAVKKAGDAHAARAALLDRRAQDLEKQLAEQADAARKEQNRQQQELERLQRELNAAQSVPEPTGLSRLFRRQTK